MSQREPKTPGKHIRISKLSHTVATVREKYLKKDSFFPGQGKVREFVDGQGNLERTWKVRESQGV